MSSESQGQGSVGGMSLLVSAAGGGRCCARLHRRFLGIGTAPGEAIEGTEGDSIFPR